MRFRLHFDPARKVPLPKRLMIAVHGVGDPAQGDNPEALARVLANLDFPLEVEELHWNTWVGKPDTENVFGYVMELSDAVMEAICVNVIPKERKLGRWPRTLGRIVEHLSPFCAMLVPFPFYVATMWAWGCPLRQAFSLIGVLLLGAFAVCGLLGLLSFNREVFWGAFRVGLLPGLWAPLGITLIFSAIPWPAIFAFAAYIALDFWIIQLIYPELHLWGGSTNANFQPLPNISWWVKTGVGGLLLAAAAGFYFALRLLWTKLYHKTKLGGVTKVLGDIFLYLGQPGYRESLVSRARGKLEGLLRDGVDDLIVGAHSLGTVVAVDALCQMQRVQSPKKITLVSAGSPLHRMFWRFFPALFPPPREIARSLRELHHNFSWVNVYRRLDYVGGRLELDSAGTDICTGQWWPMHVNYWGDVVPIKSVHAILTQNGGVSVEIAERPRNRPSTGEKSNTLYRFKRWIGLVLLWALALILPVRLTIGGISATMEQRREFTEYSHALNKRPTIVKIRYYPKAFDGGWLARNAGLDMNVSIVDRGLTGSLNPYLINVYELRKRLEAEVAKTEITGAAGYYEAEMAGEEVTSNSRLFTLLGLPPPKPTVPLLYFCSLYAITLGILGWVTYKGWDLLRALVGAFIVTDLDSR